MFNFPVTELTLGGVVIGGTAVVINEFSKEQTFIAINIVSDKEHLVICSAQELVAEDPMPNTLNVDRLQ